MADTPYHSLVLNMHQPQSNLEYLLTHNEWEAKEIMLAMERVPRSLDAYQSVGRLHLALSGTLIETLTDLEFKNRSYGIIDCDSLLWRLQNSESIELLGTAYYHPIMPLIPQADWKEQLERWCKTARRQFLKREYQGFWPPEMGFCMEMIPLLKRFGYRFALVDDEHVQPIGTMSWEELRYRPHTARFGDQEITIIVRDRYLSNAQESGMEFQWFDREVRDRTKNCDFPPLVTTCKDVHSSSWFRNADPVKNFWDAFYRPLLDNSKFSSDAIQPIFIKDYLNRFGAWGDVVIEPGAWNTSFYNGRDFLQWTGTQIQNDALIRVAEISQAVHAALYNAGRSGSYNPELSLILEEAYYRVLQSETSCNFFWDGDTQVTRCHSDLDKACECLESANQYFRSY
jgi:alpha-amylase/alpha-mannosidase (GH57 family)